MPVRVIALLLMALAMTGKTTGQHFAIKKYTVNDGLADSYILGICQDSQGFLWLGTLNGISRFDGREFMNYGYAQGLPNLVVDIIYEDHDKRLWAGTRKGVVEIKDRTCITYPVNDHQPIHYVFSIQETANKELWALTDKGVYRFNKNQWQKVALYPGLENHHCRNIIESPNGMLINYGDYLVQRDTGNHYQLLAQHTPHGWWYNKITRIDNQLHMSLPGKLLQVRGPHDTVALFEKALRKKTVGGFMRDTQGRYWINTHEDGLLVSAKNNDQLIADTIAVAFKLISGVYEDRQGNIWAACFDGLMQVREVQYDYFDFTRQHFDIRNLVTTAQNTVLASTTKGLLPCNNKGFTILPAHSATVNTFSGLADAWCNDAQGRTWLAMREGKLLLLDKYGLHNVTALVPGDSNMNWRIDYNPVNKKLYVVCTDSLLYGDTKGFHAFQSTDGTYVLHPRSIHAFSNGYMLVGAAGDRCWVIDTNGYRREVTKEIGAVELHADILFCEQPDGKFWMANSGGLSRFYWNKQHVPVRDVQITTKDGLPNDAVHALTLDAQGRLWAVVASGLVVIELNRASPHQPIVHRFSEEAGINSNQWILTRLLTDAEGLVWMSFPNSIYRFNPQLIQFNNTPPVAAIEDIQLNGQHTPWKPLTDSVYGYRQIPQQAQLPYYLNTVNISFKAPCFNGYSGIEYSWQLEGEDNTWSPPIKNSSVSFIKLPPGNYRFKVRARKSNTNWGPPASFLFVISEPYWQTWWFRTGILAIVIALLVFFFKNRLQQIQHKAQVRTQLQELELKALRSQMNPHFIYNALNSIQALVLNDQPHEASGYISKFGRLLRQVLNHSEHSVVLLQEELSALELYLQLEQLRLNFTLDYTIETAATINPLAERVPPLILQPFAENAVWHGLSKKQGDKKLHIYITTDNNWLVAEITDNGIGRKQAVGKTRQPQHVSKGMDITERRISEFNHNPAVAAIEIVDLYNENNLPIGTKVILRIKKNG